MKRRISAFHSGLLVSAREKVTGGENCPSRYSCCQIWRRLSFRNIQNRTDSLFSFSQLLQVSFSLDTVKLCELAASATL